MARASINFQKGSMHSDTHNFRKARQEPEYLLPLEYRQKNEYWRHEKTAENIFTAELGKAQRKGGAIPKFENSYWEGVLNLNKEHSLEDVKKVAEHIEKKFNVICSSIAIHRDEGRLAEDEKTPIYNLHAHLTFETYKDGKQNWRLTHTKNKLPQLQSEIANMLGMERGREGSETKRLDHKQYKAVKQAEQAMQAQTAEAKAEVVRSVAETATLKTEFEALRQKMISAGKYTGDDYKQLGELKKEIVNDKKIGIAEAFKMLEQMKTNLTEIRENNLADRMIQASSTQTAFGGQKADIKLLKENFGILINEIQELAYQNENLLQRMMRGLNKLFQKAKRVIQKQRKMIDELRKKEFFYKFVDFGEAPFQFREDAKKSFFVKYLIKDGTEKIVWGIDIKRAIENAGLQKGQFARLEITGQEQKTITIKEKVEETGKWTERKEDVIKNIWHCFVKDPQILEQNITVSKTNEKEDDNDFAYRR